VGEWGFYNSTVSASRNDNKASAPRLESWIMLLSPLKVFILFHLSSADGSSHHDPVTPSQLSRGRVI
jgi:hypothetical protein